MVVVLVILIGFGTIIHLIEPEQFPTIFDGLWWAIITASAIGYGDYVPQTFLGRVVGILLAIMGVGFVSAYFLALSSIAVKRQTNWQKGKITVPEKQHLVIIGWNERSRGIIRNRMAMKNPQPIVLIDASLEKNPFGTEKNLYFLRGKGYSEEIMEKANVKEAEMVLITADTGMQETEADMLSILTTVAIKGFSPKTYCVVEILTEDQIINAKRAGADEVVPTNQFISSLMLQSFGKHGQTKAFLNFIRQLKGSNLDILAGEIFAGLKLSEVGKSLFEEGQLLLGLIRGENTMILPKKDLRIGPGDKLLVIAPEKPK